MEVTELCSRRYRLDSGFRRNDGNTSFQAFHEIVKLDISAEEKQMPFLWARDHLSFAGFLDGDG